MIKDWNVEGIARAAMEQMIADAETLDLTEHEVETLAADALRDDYWSVYSREPKSAAAVIELCKEYIVKHWPYPKEESDEHAQ